MTSIRNLYKKTNTQTGLGAGLNLGTWDNSGTFTTGTAFDGNDSKMIIPKVTTAVRTASTPLVGEIIYDTDDDLLYRGDGVTLGGVVVGGASAFSDLTDVDTIGLQTGQQMKWTGTVWVPSSTREVLTANRTYYVRTDGNDSNNGLTDTAGGAFLTIQKAIDVVAGLDTSIYQVTIQLGSGTFSGTVTLKEYLGATPPVIIGAGSSSTTITQPSGSAVVVNAGTWVLQNVKLTALENDIYVAEKNASIYFRNVDFGAAERHVLVFRGVAVADGDYSISGTASRHVSGFDFGLFYVVNATITITNSPNFTAGFVVAGRLSSVVIVGCSFVGTATGIKYTATQNAVINTSGGGADYLPGNTSGTVATGGQYV